MSDIVERLATARNMMELERAAADAIAELERLRDKALRFDLDQAGIERREREAVELVEGRAEIERLRSALATADEMRRADEAKIALLSAGYEQCGATLDEVIAARSNNEVYIKRLQEDKDALLVANAQWQSACAGYTEALAARDRDNAALLEDLARIRDQIAKHNISIKEAIRRGEAFEWKTLTLDS